jgi:hypothetical protein
METVCRLPLVTTIETAGLVVFTGTDPKLSEAGVIPTPACTKMGKNTEVTKSNPKDRHTRLVLSMAINPRIRFKELDQERAQGGLSFAARHLYF